VVDAEEGETKEKEELGKKGKAVEEEEEKKRN
jgi:hypothetical protein